MPLGADRREVATVTTEVERLRPYQLALREMHGSAKLDDGFSVAADVADKILMAETIEDILAVPESGPGSIEELQGKMFRFIGGSLRYADSAEKYREGGTGQYAFFRCIDSKGTEHAVTTGATNIVFQLKALQRKGVFDNDGEVYDYDFTVKSREVASGTLYWLGAP